MPDPHLAVPESATPNWLLRYGDWRARRYDRRRGQMQHMLPRLRNRTARRTLVVILAALLAAAVGSSVLGFWNLGAGAIGFLIGVVGALIALTTLRVTTEATADAPAGALDELELTQRNAARSLAYLAVIPMIAILYILALSLGRREWVAGDTLAAYAWLMITLFLTVTCIPDMLLSWWRTDEDEE